MKRTSEEVRTELLKDMPEGYVIPDDNDKLQNARLKAKQFCSKRFNKNMQSVYYLNNNDYRSLWHEMKTNGDLFYIIHAAFEIGYYRGYKRAEAEIKAKLKEQK